MRIQGLPGQKMDLSWAALQNQVERSHLCGGVLLEDLERIRGVGLAWSAKSGEHKRIPRHPVDDELFDEEPVRIAKDGVRETHF